MFWMHHPRTIGLLISLPAVPAMIATLVWVLEPSAVPPATPAVAPGTSVVDVHERIRRTLELDGGHGQAVPWTTRPGAADAPGASPPRDPGEQPTRRVGIYRDGRQVGWVAATPGMLATVAANNLDDMARRADAAHEASLVEQQRFAEAHTLSLANLDARDGATQRVTRTPSGLVRLMRTGSTAGSGPRFQRPDFVDALAQERAQVRRASERRSRSRTTSSSAR